CYRYVALSHRCGACQHFTTKLANVAKFKHGIKFDDLPKTFQDAVSLARHLGFVHMWIDALCIIQDSAQDWLQESRKMGYIFMDAEVIFAIHCAKDGSDGFLNGSLSKCHAISYHALGGTVGICRPLEPEREIMSSDLSRRGWVLQERFLSCRTLHFLPGQVY
ncbi:heterokaryon incompatibility, partial [Setomelanomma holmii]